MSAFRFVRQLRQEGFLDIKSESLRLVRREERMHRWQAAHLFLNYLCAGSSQ
jgi:hypothetical protein